MKRITGILVLVSAIFVLSACAPTDSDSRPDSTEKKISKDTLIKQVCLNGVSYYATWVTDSIDSIAGRSYLVVGGPVFAKGSAIPTSCEGAAPELLSGH